MVLASAVSSEPTLIPSIELRMRAPREKRGPLSLWTARVLLESVIVVCVTRIQSDNRPTRGQKKGKISLFERASFADPLRDRAMATVTLDEEWVVVEETYPSAWGCYSGQPPRSDAKRIALTEFRVVGWHAEYDQAEEAARECMERSEWFGSWGEEYYADEPPPYNSMHGENYDNDEEVLIYVQTRKDYEASVQKRKGVCSRQ